MLLAIDVGNTNTILALFKGHELVDQWRVATIATRTSDEYACLFATLNDLHKVHRKDIKDVIIASVVPQTVYPLTLFSKEACGCDPIIVGTDGLKLGVSVKLDRLGEVGADRLVNASAAVDIYEKNVIIIDFGTATTFDVIDEDQNYIGGVIAPGVNLSIQALHEAAANLPKIDVERPEKVVGSSTVSAMQSGVYYGYIGMIEGIVARIQEERGGKMQVIATGGLSSLFCKATQTIDELEQDLTILGLKHIYMLNK